MIEKLFYSTMSFLGLRPDRSFLRVRDRVQVRFPPPWWSACPWRCAWGKHLELTEICHQIWNRYHPLQFVQHALIYQYYLSKMTEFRNYNKTKRLRSQRGYLNWCNFYRVTWQMLLVGEGPTFSNRSCIIRINWKVTRRPAFYFQDFGCGKP